MESSKSKNNFIKIYMGFSSIAIIVLFVLVLAKKEDKYMDLLRTRGIVIVDKNDMYQFMGGECLEGKSSIASLRRHLKE